MSRWRAAVPRGPFKSSATSVVFRPSVAFPFTSRAIALGAAIDYVNSIGKERIARDPGWYMERTARPQPMEQPRQVNSRSA